MQTLRTYLITHEQWYLIWRYEKYINERIILKQLNTFLKRLQQKSNFIRLEILPRLDQLIDILSLLITVCIAYICIDQQSKKVDVLPTFTLPSDVAQFLNTFMQRASII
jgi:hypothetical protein